MVDVDTLSSLTDSDSLFVNSDGSLKQVAVEDAGLMRMDLLWENASPTSAFAAQTISLFKDVTDYDMFAIEIRRATSFNVDDAINQFVVPNGYGTNYTYQLNAKFASANATLYSYGRSFYFADSTSVYFYEAYYHATNATTTTVNNANVIPIAIYGIKGIQ